MHRTIIFWSVVIIIVIAFIHDPTAFGHGVHSLFGLFSTAGNAASTAVNSATGG